MTDVRLTATNPEDSSVVPVACNEKGELKLEEPQVTSDLYVEKAGDTMTGNLHLGDKVTLNPDGSAQFANGKIDFYQDGTSEFDQTVTATRFTNDGRTDPWLKGYNGPSESFNVAADGSLRVIGTGSPLAPAVLLTASGAGTFTSDVIIGSRNEQWMIVESNGLAHLVKQTRAEGIETADLTGETADLTGKVQYPPLRDIPGELTMVEEQLQKVLEKLRMVPEAGWEVWDGSD